MDEMLKIVEGIVSRNRSNIVQKLNDVLSMLSQASNDIGYDKVDAKYIKSPVDSAILEVGLPNHEIMTIRVYDTDDIKITIPTKLAQALKIPNYYELRPGDIDKREAAILSSDIPLAVNMTIIKLQEIYSQFRKYLVKSK